MYQTIVIPLDGSALAKRVLAHALTIARTFDCNLHLVRATEEAEGESGPTEYIAQEAASLRSAGFDVSQTVKAGSPADVIIEAAEAQAEPLIAMTTHGRSGIGRWMLGSVADKTLQASSVLLLLVRPTTEINMTHGPFIERVLLAVDGSELAELAIPHAAAVAKELRVTAIVVRVVQGYVATAVDAPPSGDLAPQEPVEQDVAEERAYVSKIAGQLREQGVSEVQELVIGRWDAAEEILGAAGSPGTLIVMTSRGRSGVKRWALGSVTERVVRYGSGPVLVIRAG